MAEDAPTLLASQAADLSLAIYRALSKRCLKPSDWGYRAAYDIAVRLHLINSYLGSLPPYWIEFDVEQLCRTILRDLQALTRPTKGSASSTLLPSLFYFATSFGRNEPEDLETCLATFFKVQPENAQSFRGACDDLLGRLTRGENDTEGLPDPALQHLDTPDTSADFNDGIFKALQLIAECDPASHDTTGTVLGEQNSRTLRHPVRLCLHEVENGQDLVSRNIGVLVSTIDMTLWQEFCLRMYVYPAQ